MGKYSVLVGQSGALKRERTSMLREMLMTVALSKVQRMNPEEFQSTVSCHAFSNHRVAFFIVKYLQNIYTRSLKGLHLYEIFITTIHLHLFKKPRPLCLVNVLSS